MKTPSKVKKIILDKLPGLNNSLNHMNMMSNNKAYVNPTLVVHQAKAVVTLKSTDPLSETGMNFISS